MYEKIREEAVQSIEDKRSKKRTLQSLGFLFASVCVILYIVSTRFYGDTAFWIKFPMIILTFIYGFIHVSMYGFSFFGESDELSDEDIEREMANIYRKSNLEKLADIDGKVDGLELKEIETLIQKHDNSEDLV